MLDIRERWAYHIFEKEIGVLARLTVGNHQKNKTIKHHGLVSERDLCSYWNLRKIIEQRMYNRFVAKGGIPQTKSPFYFSLDHPVDIKYYHNPIDVKCKVKYFLSNTISFCLGDSFNVFLPQNQRKKIRKLFLLHEMNEVLLEYGDSFTEVSDSNYIEMQLWDENEMISIFKHSKNE